MKNHRSLIKFAAFALLSTFPAFYAAQLSTAFAQGSAFTYQGQLQSNGGLASGSYNLTFTLFTNSTGGTAVAGPVTNSAVAITNGLFTVTIDFGSGVWNGATNWLQIGVETNGASSSTTLTPRQQLSPVPYAIYAEGANAAGLSGTIPMAGLSGTYGGAVSLTNAGNSFTGNGIGLTNVNAATLGGLAAGNFWQLGGNANVPTGSNVIGTLNNQPLDLYVDSLRALHLILQTDATGIYSNAPNVIGGSSVNQINSGVVGGTIGGGGGTDKYGGIDLNTVTADFGTVSGGEYNSANGQFSTVSGGGGNTASGDYATTAGFLNVASGEFSTVSGGDQNAATNEFATVPGGFGNGALGNAATAGGGIGNTASGPTATVAGGYDNTASGNTATVAGGYGNTASGDYSTVSGGDNNTASAIGSFIGGGGYDGNYGAGNQVQSRAATICGGFGNDIPSGAIYAFIGGGCFNTASGMAATVSGGTNNTASGNYSFAAGSDAQAKNDGSFVWSDGTPSPYFSSTADNQFLVYASGGVGIGTNAPQAQLHVTSNGGNSFPQAQLDQQNPADYSRLRFTVGGLISKRWDLAATETNFVIYSASINGNLIYLDKSGLTVNGAFVSSSDRNVKAGFQPVDVGNVLDRVAAMPITRWYYTNDVATTHLGPMAQDFYAAFNVGMDDKHIATVDEEGVALAAIQGLNQKLNEKDAEIQQLKQSVAQLDGMVAQLAETRSH